MGVCTMNTGKNKLFDISKRIIEQEYQHYIGVADVIFEDNSLQDIFDSRMNEKKEDFERIEKLIDIEVFIQFLKAPQIVDINSNYFCYLLGLNILGIEDKEKTLADNIKNKFMDILTNYYSKLSDDNSILAIKNYFDILTHICSKKIVSEEKKYSAYRRFTLFNNKPSQISTNTFHGRNIQKINKGIDSKFISRNVENETIKDQYIKALKQIYQMGFIYLLGEFKFNDFYIPPNLALVDDLGSMPKTAVFLSRITYKKTGEIWNNIFDSRDIIYIVGGAGYGKSFFLKNIINNYDGLGIVNCQEYLLIYCDLKSYYSIGDSNKKTMIDFFQESMINITGVEGITKEFIKYYLDLGRCIFLLDALDEVPKDVRSDLHKKLIGFFSTCNLNNKVCITSRDRGFLPQQDIEVLEILPLTYRDIENYIAKMISLKKFKKEDKETFMRQAKVLIEKNFLNNFLVLSLLVNIYKSEKELPENKIDLYKKCFEYIAKKREEEKSKTGYNWNNIYPLMKDSTFISLSVLGAPNNKDIEREKVEELLLKQYKTKYSDESVADCAIKEFLEFCSNRTELFVPSSTDDKFKFFHRSFFEYFYSRYIHQQDSILTMYELMSAFDLDSEIFELTIALVKEDNEGKYQNLVKHIFTKIEYEFTQNNGKCTAFCIMTLAMQVIDDSYFIQKYFDDVIMYSKCITKNKINNINQKLLYMWIEKGIGADKDKLEKFKETYETDCVCYLLNIISGLQMGNQHYLDDNIKFSIIHELQFENRKMPFYLMVYNKYYSLIELLNGYDKKKFNVLCESVDVTKKEKNLLRKGFKYYNELKLEDKENLLEWLFSK